MGLPPSTSDLCCSAADTEAINQPPQTQGSFFNYGVPEKNEPKRPALALASWTDSSRQSLTCPRCGIEEIISTKS